MEIATPGTDGADPRPAAAGKDSPQQQSETLIEIEELHFSFGEQKVFDGLSLCIPRGKVVAILGASGSGKSTLVLMKLQAVGLRGTADLMPSELSGGMARRVALARAIAVDPMLTMYDEPFAGLDPISLNVIAQLIRRLNDALRATSIIVTYDVSESLKLADHAFLLYNGKVEAEGSPQELLASTAPFVDQFLHARPTGPVAFHMESAPYQDDLGLGAQAVK